MAAVRLLPVLTIEWIKNFFCQFRRVIQTKSRKVKQVLVLDGERRLFRHQQWNPTAIFFRTHFQTDNF